MVWNVLVATLYSEIITGLMSVFRLQWAHGTTMARQLDGGAPTTSTILIIEFTRNLLNVPNMYGSEALIWSHLLFGFDYFFLQFKLIFNQLIIV